MENLIKYILVKEPYWDIQKFNTINWVSMGICLDKMPPTRVTNTLKLVHGWQHDGYQKGIVFGIGESCDCRAGSGLPGNHLHCIYCQTHMTKKEQIK